MDCAGRIEGAPFEQGPEDGLYQPAAVFCSAARVVAPRFPPAVSPVGILDADEYGGPVMHDAKRGPDRGRDRVTQHVYLNARNVQRM